jgi:hypothetical protein
LTDALPTGLGEWSSNWERIEKARSTSCGRAGRRGAAATGKELKEETAEAIVYINTKTYVPTQQLGKN